MMITIKSYKITFKAKKLNKLINKIIKNKTKKIKFKVIK